MQNRTDLALELKEEKNIGSAESGIIVKTRIDTANHIKETKIIIKNKKGTGGRSFCAGSRRCDHKTGGDHGKIRGSDRKIKKEKFLLENQKGVILRSKQKICLQMMGVFIKK